MFVAGPGQWDSGLRGSGCRANKCCVEDQAQAAAVLQPESHEPKSADLGWPWVFICCVDVLSRGRERPGESLWGLQLSECDFCVTAEQTAKNWSGKIGISTAFIANKSHSYTLLFYFLKYKLFDWKFCFEKWHFWEGLVLEASGVPIYSIWNSAVSYLGWTCWTEHTVDWQYMV